MRHIELLVHETSGSSNCWRERQLKAAEVTILAVVCANKPHSRKSTYNLVCLRTSVEAIVMRIALGLECKRCCMLGLECKSPKPTAAYTHTYAHSFTRIYIHTHTYTQGVGWGMGRKGGVYGRREKERERYIYVYTYE